jgi:MFS family permease
VTDLYGDTLAGPRTAEEHARAIAGWTGRLGFVAAVVGTLGVLSARYVDTLAWRGGMVLLLAGLLAGIGCIVHGSRHEHERGRGFAIAAIAVGLLVASAASWAAYKSACPARYSCGVRHTP